MIIRIKFSNPIPYSMLLLGLVALLSSFLSSSYVLASIGLELTFWGALFLYIMPTKYVKLELLNATSFSTLANIEKILSKAETVLKVVYLSPNLLEDHASSLVFIPAKPNQPLPTSKGTNPQELQSKNPKGLLITPPGLALSKLLEKENRKPFTETGLEDLRKQLPKLLEELQITKNTNVQTEGNTVTVEMNNHIFEDLCKETRKLKNPQNSRLPIIKRLGLHAS